MSTYDEAKVELQTIRHVLFDQLAHVQRLEANGLNRDFERSYLNRKVQAIDFAMDCIDVCRVRSSLEANGAPQSNLTGPSNAA